MRRLTREAYETDESRGDNRCLTTMILVMLAPVALAVLAILAVWLLQLLQIW